VLKASDDFVRLERAFAVRERVIVYAYCEIESLRDADTDLRCWANYMAAAWVNGRLVGRTPGQFGPRNVNSATFLPVTLKAGRNACLVKVRQIRGECQFSFQMFSTGTRRPARLGDRCRRTERAGAAVQVLDGARVIAQTRTDANGVFRALIYPVPAALDLSVAFGDLGFSSYDLSLQPGELRRIEANLREAASTVRTVLTLDGETPQTAIPVQVTRQVDNWKAATVLTDKNGRYQFLNLLKIRSARMSIGRDRIFQGESAFRICCCHLFRSKPRLPQGRCGCD
jgi:hypothetical protein